MTHKRRRLPEAWARILNTQGVQGRVPAPDHCLWLRTPARLRTGDTPQAHGLDSCEKVARPGVCSACVCCAGCRGACGTQVCKSSTVCGSAGAAWTCAQVASTCAGRSVHVCAFPGVTATVLPPPSSAPGRGVRPASSPACPALSAESLSYQHTSGHVTRKAVDGSPMCHGENGEDPRCPPSSSRCPASLPSCSRGFTSLTADVLQNLDFPAVA